MRKLGKRLIAFLILFGIVTTGVMPVPVYATAKAYTVTAEELKDMIMELLPQMELTCTCRCPYCADKNSTNLSEETAEKAAPAALCLPEQIHVFVDGTQSVTATLLDKQGAEYLLSDTERLNAVCDGSVARADVYGQSVTLTGVQNGTTTLTLQVQRKNEQDIFETVMTDVDGVFVPLEVSATVTVD